MKTRSQTKKEKTEHNATCAMGVKLLDLLREVEHKPQCDKKIETLFHKVLAKWDMSLMQQLEEILILMKD